MQVNLNESSLDEYLSIIKSKLYIYPRLHAINTSKNKLITRNPSHRTPSHLHRTTPHHLDRPSLHQNKDSEIRNKHPESTTQGV